MIHPISGHILETFKELHIFPATHYVVSDQKDESIKRIKDELIQTTQFYKDGKSLEAHRLNQRTNYDLEMIQEMDIVGN